MTRLAYSSNTQMLRNNPIVLYINPIKNNLHGVFSAFRGVIIDSRTIT
jgi:hypothetical protein